MDPDHEHRTTAFAMAAKRAIQAAGLTQATVADRIGRSTSQLGDWLNKPGSEPNPRAAVALEEAIGVNPGELTVHLGFLPLAAAQVTISEPEEAIIADRSLTREHKELLLRMIEALRAEP